MMTRFDVPLGGIIRIPVTTFNSDGASVTLSGLTVEDVRIFKDGALEERGPDAGYTVFTDFDGRTGLHIIEIDTSEDDSPALFWTDGSEYNVAIDAVTVDSQTVRFWAAWFRIVAVTDVSDIHSLLTLVRSDTTVIETVTSDIQSDTNKLVSDATEVDTSDIHSLLTLVRSDTTVIETVTSDIRSQTVRIHSDTITLASDLAEADLSDIHSRLTLVLSDTSDVVSRLTVVFGAAGVVSDMASKVVRILSDTTQIQSDTTVIETVTSDIQSDTNKLVSDATEVDTSDILSLLTLVRSDTAVIEAVTSDIQSDTNIAFTKMRGLVLFNGTIGATGNTTTAVHVPDLGTYSDDELNNYFLVIYDVSEAEYHVRQITDWTTTGDLATVSTLPFTPQASTDLYWLLSEQSGASSGGLTAAQDSRLTQIHSDTQPVGTLFEIVSDIYSDTTAIEGAGGGLTVAQASQLAETNSQVVRIHSDTITLASDLAEGDFSDILSRLTLVHSETTAIQTAQASQFVVLEQNTSDTESMLVLIRSDTTHIESDAVVIEAIVSDVQSDTSDIQSKLVVLAAVASDIQSDTNVMVPVISDIQSDTNLLITRLGEGDWSDILSRLTVTNSDAARIESKVVQIYSDTTKIDTQTLDIQSETEVIQSDTARVESKVVQIYSDTTKIDTQTLDIQSETEVIQSQSVAIRAIVSDIQSDTNVILPAVQDIQSETEVIQSQVLIVKSDTSDIRSALTIIASDTAVIETADNVWDEAIDGAITARQLMRLYASALGGKASGLGTTTATYRDLADSKDRITATVDADGNRTAVTRDLT